MWWFCLTSSALSAGTSSSCAPSLRTRSSISSTMRSASSLRPWVINQRGLSGIVRRSPMMTSPITGPMKKPMRQPTLDGTCELSR